MLTEHISDEDVVEEIFAAINSLSTNSLENRSHFHIAKAEGVMLKAIAKHEKVCYVCLFVLLLEGSFCCAISMRMVPYCTNTILVS